MSGSVRPSAQPDVLKARGARDWLRRFRVALSFGVRADPRRFALLVASETIAGIAHLAALFRLKLLTDAAVGQSGSNVLIQLVGGALLLGRLHPLLALVPAFGLGPFL